MGKIYCCNCCCTCTYRKFSAQCDKLSLYFPLYTSSCFVVPSSLSAVCLSVGLSSPFAVFLYFRRQHFPTGISSQKRGEKGRKLKSQYFFFAPLQFKLSLLFFLSLQIACRSWIVRICYRYPQNVSRFLHGRNKLMIALTFLSVWDIISTCIFFHIDIVFYLTVIAFSSSSLDRGPRKLGSHRSNRRTRIRSRRRIESWCTLAHSSWQ